MTVLIGGDTFPGYFEQDFVKAEIHGVFGDLLVDLHSADLTVVNLETPLTDTGEPIRKVGPHFRTAPEAANGLRAAGIDAVTLANNHILDYGEVGIRQTVEVLREVGIVSFGAGRNLREASQVAVFEQNNVRVALLGMAEHEFSIANDHSWGANPIDLIRFVELMDELEALADPIDHLVILLHAGNEYYEYPSPWLQRLCRFLIDQGASAVICQHSHVAGTYELYNGRLIVYGQGNFVYGRKGALHGREGFLVKLVLQKNGVTNPIEIIPFIRTEIGLRRMTDLEESNFFRSIDKRNQVLQSPQELDRMWRAFVSSRKHAMLSRLTGLPRLISALIHRVGLTDWWFAKYDFGPSLNYVKCESHRQVLITLLESMVLGSKRTNGTRLENEGSRATRKAL